MGILDRIFGSGCGGSGHGSGQPDRAEEIVYARYGKGEITLEQKDHMLQVLRE